MTSRSFFEKTWAVNVELSREQRALTVFCLFDRLVSVHLLKKTLKKLCDSTSQESIVIHFILCGEESYLPKDYSLIMKGYSNSFLKLNLQKNQKSVLVESIPTQDFVVLEMGTVPLLGPLLKLSLEVDQAGVALGVGGYPGSQSSVFSSPAKLHRFYTIFDMPFTCGHLLFKKDRLLGKSLQLYSPSNRKELTSFYRGSLLNSSNFLLQSVNKIVVDIEMCEQKQTTGFKTDESQYLKSSFYSEKKPSEILDLKWDDFYSLYLDSVELQKIKGNPYFLAIQSFLDKSTTFKSIRIVFSLVNFFLNLLRFIFGFLKRGIPASCMLLRDFFGSQCLFEIPVVINNRNRLSTLKSLILSLEGLGFKKVMILDNDSTYPPLLEFYQSTQCSVCMLQENKGPMALWKSDVWKKLKHDFYIYTDSDVVPSFESDSEMGRKFLRKMLWAFVRHPTYQKIGLGLQIDDLPSTFKNRSAVIDHEKKYWDKKTKDHYFIAPVDTTFAIYAPGESGGYWLRALRTGPPFLGKHLPWYVDSSHLPEEELFYQKYANHWSTWG